MVNLFHLDWRIAGNQCVVSIALRQLCHKMNTYVIIYFNMLTGIFINNTVLDSTCTEVYFRFIAFKIFYETFKEIGKIFKPSKFENRSINLLSRFFNITWVLF